MVFFVLKMFCGEFLLLMLMELLMIIA
jgi:hypothetical protein